MADEAVSQHVLKYTTDEASVTRSIQAVERIKDTFASTSKVVNEVARPIREVGKATDELKRGEKSVDAMAAAYEELRARAEELHKQLDAVKKQLKETDQAFVAADGPEQYETRIKQAAKDTELYGDVGTRIRDIGGVAGLVGGAGVSQKFMVGGELLEAAEGFGRIKEELPALISSIGLSVPALGVLGLAIGAAGLAYKGLTDALDKQKRAAEEAKQAMLEQLEWQERINFLRIVGGTEELDAEKKRLEGEKAAKEDSLKQNEALIAEYKQREQEILDLQTRIAEAAADRNVDLQTQLNAELDRLVTNLFPIDIGIGTVIKDQNQLEAVTSDLQTTRDEITALGEQLAPLDVALKTTVRHIEENTKAFEKNTKFLPESSEKQVGYEREQALRQRAAAQELLNDIIGVTTDSVKVFTGVADDMNASLVDGAERLAEYAEATADVQESRAIEAQRDQENALRKRVNDLADHYADMADLDTDYYGERQDILDGLSEDLGDVDQERLNEIADYNKESRRLAEDHKDEILRIQRETNRSYNEAARARDTAGALAALRQGEQRLDDEQDQYETEQDRREEDIRDLVADLEAERREKIEAAQKELRDLEAKHRKERAERERAFAEELRREDEQRRLAAQRQQEDWAREDQKRQAHFGVVETATGTHYSNVLGRTTTGLANIGASFTTWLSGLAASTQSIIGSGSPPTPYVPTDEGHYGYAYGGSPRPFTEVKLGERGKAEMADFGGGYQMKVAAGGSERAMFLDPVRIYAREQAQRTGSVINVSLGGLGGVQIQAGAGASARSIAEQGGRQLYSMVVDALEQIVNDYAGGS